jgi:CheY-like chemotaxis protein
VFDISSVLAGLIVGVAGAAVFCYATHRRAEVERSRLLAYDRAARLQAEQASQLRDAFVSAVSHELRAPLNAILGWVSILRQDQGPRTIARGLDVIYRNCRRQSQMIEDLVSTGRVTAAKLALDGQSVDSTLETLEARGRSLTSLIVLVVDDEDDARDLAQRLLERAGAAASSVATAEEALEKLTDGLTPDLIVSDIDMPGLDGYEFMRRVRRMRGPIADVPAVAMTALARGDDRKRALLAGYQTHLAKPVDPAELIATVASLTHRTGRESLDAAST